MHKQIASVVFILVVFTACAQNKRVDTVPFTTNNLFLVFKGSINGVETDFAFDTGAGTSVTNSTTNAQCGITVKGGKSVRDANQTVTKLQTAMLNDIAVGGYHVRNLKAVTADMPYLYCANLVLLGQDFIKQFNWKIDFEKQLIYLSETPFEATDAMQVWKPRYKGNRPFVDVSFNNSEAVSCLIDLGFTATFDIHINNKEAQQLLAQRQQTKQVNQYLTANMGLSGLGAAAVKNDFISDSIHVGSSSYANVLTTLRPDAETKLGLQFFKSYVQCFILNHTTDTYYVQPLLKSLAAAALPDARFTLKNGRFNVFDKNTGATSTAALLQIGEQVKSINAQTPDAFKSECDFLLWMYQYKAPELLVEKMNGDKLVIKRSSAF